MSAESFEVRAVVREVGGHAKPDDDFHGGVHSVIGPRPPGLALSPTSARTDLLITRQEISRLRDEVRVLREGMHLQLGRQVDQLDGRDLQKRLTEMTSENHRLSTDAHTAGTESRYLKERVQALEDDLTAARTSLRCMTRDENRPLSPAR